MTSSDIEAQAAGSFCPIDGDISIVDPASSYTSISPENRSRFLSNPEIDGFIHRLNGAIQVLNFPQFWCPLITQSDSKNMVYGTSGSPLDHCHVYTKEEIFSRDVLTFVSGNEHIPDAIKTGPLVCEKMEELILTDEAPKDEILKKLIWPLIFLKITSIEFSWRNNIIIHLNPNNLSHNKI